MTRPIVIALGGNAISRADEEGNLHQQFEHTRESAEHIAGLIEAGHHLVITHGNGPQVGKILRRVELSSSEVYPIPLHICVANTQAGMGYMICQCLNNALAKRGIDIHATTLITTVEIDPADPAFTQPTKPIGSTVSAEKADEYRRVYNWDMIPVGDDFRRVVASPAPQKIMEMELIHRLVEANETIVVGGGGGIAVRRTPTGEHEGVDCVIDKDRTSALLAAELNASLFMIATGVEKVAVNFRKPGERWLDRITLLEAKELLAAGQFPAGTMGPKIQAAIDFLSRSSSPDAEVLITDLENMSRAMTGKTGTRIVKDQPPL